jgi:biopolymer transport protein TolR
MNRSHRRLRRKPMADINVVPYIDVSLVLLIIFMITAPLEKNSEVEVDLPQANGKNLQTPFPPLIVSIDKNGQYYLAEASQAEILVPLETLLRRVAHLQQQHAQLEVYIKGDQHIDYGKVMSIMTALKTAGVEHVGLMTAPTE